MAFHSLLHQEHYCSLLQIKDPILQRFSCSTLQQKQNTSWRWILATVSPFALREGIQSLNIPNMWRHLDLTRPF